ncbi:isochorismatase [Vibrio azureus]|uniref:SnoaL-like domain-containing protein n=2 Tax=Vibrio harveyi group TaxID=717610 RepID=U3ALU5_9VIBR|nr:MULTISPECIES: nuclear transport factor 2 family protein [Vibrio harveyi group]AUI85960.1 isochorismatase [Vibrio azureus]PNQ65378.1 isochorismatase [Vibrio agarivorans]GAD74267.1 hypothetical protein VAZ01S_008_00090 [Vibrio azureus NBRC 104587]GEM75376.1 hypothetical protein VSA01S_14880 [Vibrio sagamiensis NBRC 104589]
MSQEILDACKAASLAWQNAFNSGDAKGCAEQYVEDCEMVAKPFGTFKGREEIETFWANLIEQGFSDVEYIDTEWEAVDNNCYILSSKWKMNKAYGVVHKEHFQVQSDGKARLIYDEFEALGER